MGLEYRGEGPEDAAAIDRVTCSAFESMDEANITRLMRQYSPLFDPEYSVTAWDGDELVGHALFTPAKVRYMDETVRALAMGPIAVAPRRQRQGIGGELLRFGHQKGRKDGYAFVFINGHPSYYPRYGYKACFGFARATIDTERLPAPKSKFTLLPVTQSDVPWLVARHFAEWRDVDFGWIWGEGLTEWTHPPMNAVVWWTEDGRRAAYTVAKPGRGKCTLLLAEDPALAREVLATIRPPTLDHHPSGWLARNVLEPAWSKAAVRAGDPAMAFELEEGILGPCLEAQKRGRPPGYTMFPLPFLAC